MARSISNEFHKLPHLLIAINLNSTRELSEREEKTIKWMFIFEWATETKRYSINYYKIATITTQRKEKRAKQKKRLCLHIIDVVRYYRSFDMCVSLFFFTIVASPFLPFSGYWFIRIVLCQFPVDIEFIIVHNLLFSCLLLLRLFVACFSRFIFFIAFYA